MKTSSGPAFVIFFIANFCQVAGMIIIGFIVKWTDCDHLKVCRESSNISDSLFDEQDRIGPLVINK